MTTELPTNGPAPAGQNTLRTVLLVFGSIILAIALAVAGVRVANSLDREDTSGEYTVTQQFESIDLRTSAADVEIHQLQVDKPELRFDQGNTNLRLEHSVSDGVLHITVDHEGLGWWGFGDWNFGDFGLWNNEGAKLIVALPEELDDVSITYDGTAGNLDVAGEYADVNLESTAGDLRLTGGADSLELTTTAGDVTMDDYSLRGPFRSESTAGEGAFQFSTLPERMDVRSTAGDVRVELPRGDYRIETDSTAGEIQQDASSNSSSDRVYVFETTAGDIFISER